MSGLYNSLIDGDQFHNDEVKVIGTPQQIPVGEAYSHITGKMEPFGGKLSTAVIRGQHLDAVDLVEVDYEAAARRNLEYIRENVARRRAREEKENRDAAGN